MVNSGRAKHASLGGVWGSSPRIFGESKCPEIDSGGIWQPSINHSCDSTCTCKLPQVQVTVVIGTGDHYLSTAVLLHV